MENNQHWEGEVMEQTKKKYLSFSQINMWLRCPLQYRFRYIQGMKIPPKSALTLGKSVHQGIEHNYRQKVDSHKDLKVSEVCEKYSEAFDVLKRDTLWMKDEKPGEIKDEGAGLIKVYHKIVAPKVQPLYVEQKFHLEFVDFLFDLRGFIDLVTIKKIIKDHKTTKMTPNQAKIDKDLQLTVYSLGYRMKYKEVEKGVGQDYMVRLKTPKIVQLKSKRTEANIKCLLKLIGYVSKGITEEMFYPNPHNILCNEKSCGYWDMCQGGKKW